MRSAALVLAAVLLAACTRQAEEKKPAGPPAVLVTLARAETGMVEVTEQTLGTLEAVFDPKISAEAPGRIVRMLAGPGKPVKKGELLALIDDADSVLAQRTDEADIRRVEALLAQQQRLVERQRQLVAKGFISPNAAEDAATQRDALREQLAAARVRAEQSRRTQGKARVLAPFDAVVETRIASEGDYVKVGDPLFQLVSRRKLLAHLPFPESAAPRIARGQPVRIRSPQAPEREIRGVVSEIRPNVSETSRALDVLVELDNDGSLRSGGTVDAAVIVMTRRDAVLVPERSVVLRPAGKVVYVVSEGKAHARTVLTGAKRADRVEIVKGLAAGVSVALDGAGFLSDGAAVKLAETARESR